MSRAHALADQAVVSGTNFFIITLAARYLPAEDVGKYGYAYALYMLNFMLAYALIYQNVASTSRQKLKEWSGNFVWLNLFLAIIMAPIALLVFYWLSPMKGGVDLWVGALLVAFFVFANQSIDYCRRILYFNDHGFLLKKPAYVSIAGFGARIPAVILLHPRSFNEMMAILCIVSIPAVLLYFHALAMMRPRRITQFVGVQLRSGRWMLANIPVNWAWGQAPVFLVGSWLGIQDAGIFSAIRAIANLPNVVLEMVPTYFASRLRFFRTEKDNDGYRSYIRNLFLIGFVAGLVGVVILGLFANEIIRLVLGEVYQPYSTLLILLWCFIILLFFIRIQFLHLRFVEKTFVAPVAHLLGVLVLFFVFYFFLPLGVKAMGWAMLAGGVAIVLVQLSAPFLGEVK